MLKHDTTRHKTTIYRWYAEFRRGRAFLRTVPFTGQLKTVATPENLATMQEIIQGDRHATYEHIQATMDVGKTQNVFTELHIGGDSIECSTTREGPAGIEPVLGTSLICERNETPDPHTSNVFCCYLRCMGATAVEGTWSGGCSSRHLVH
ncbi:hypothetical protein EVAR_67369_1 [Eumeta japonica]|uniref:Mos1 transposase HTH domain-containing protein n=1 Tax=Eumeta variegata TaxID=151549 RepID=A0A4C1ZT67_EUMVA|nr:hypothetical protein EVAR_67369_1 [Eumeta japonica]